MSIVNLRKITDARIQQYKEKSRQGSSNDNEIAKLLEALFRYIESSNKSILNELNNISSKLDKLKDGEK